MSSRNPVIYQQVQEEQYQGPVTRKQLFIDLEKELGRPVVSFFTSLHHPVIIEDTDADMLEGVLQKMDLSNGLALLISSLGGYGEAAERIINVCRNASGTGEFWAIVPGKAKSAATMVCFGASEIWMRTSAELGPIDPQIAFVENGQRKWFSICNIVESYKRLFAAAVRTDGNIEPYLQQLSHYDEREIEEYKAAISLAEDIAIRSLASGMMSRLRETTIKKKIEVFLTPKKTKSHGRPIYRDEAAKCGLKVKQIDEKTHLEKLMYELYIRTLNYTAIWSYKCIESKDHAFSAPVAPMTEKGDDHD